MKSLYILLLSALVLTSTSLRAQEVKKGSELFNANCKACHSIGGGKIVGPDLKGVHERRKEDWLKKFIASPGTMIKSGDATAKQLFEENNKILMPDHTFLKESEIKDILAYIKEEGNKTAAAPAAEEAKAETKTTEATASNKATAETKATETSVVKEPSTPVLDKILYSMIAVSLILLVFALSLLLRTLNYRPEGQKHV